MKQSVISHLEELRSRLIVVLVVLTTLFIAGFFASNYVIKFLESSFLTGKGVDLIVTGPIEFLYVKMKLGFFLAVTLAFPLIVYEALMFAKPGLGKKEKKLMMFCLPLSIILFLAGILFCYFVLLKVSLWFLARIALDAGVKNLWSLDKFITFTFLACLALGLIFQIPVVLYILNKFGIINVEMLKSKRKYAIVLIFIFAAVITPTLDMFTQLLVAVPMIALYELSIILIRFLR